MKSSIREKCKKSGTTVESIEFKRLKNFSIPLPPLPEQHRIVAKIETLFTRLDAGVSALVTLKTQLKRYRQAVLKSAMEGKLTAKWREEHKGELEPASVLLERIKAERKKRLGEKYKELPPVDTEGLAELPDGWEWVRTGQLCECIVPNRDKPKSFAGNIPWITLPDFTGKILLQNSATGQGLTLEEIRCNRARLIPEGSVVMSCVGRFGISAVLGCDAVINQQLHAFLIPKGLSAKYLAYSIRTQEQYLNKISTSTTIAYLNKKKCNSVPVPLPPTLEQHCIVIEIECYLSITDEVLVQIEDTIVRAERLRQSILKRAFEGKLVPQDPNDEPASRLLERIRKEKGKVVMLKKKRRRS